MCASYGLTSESRRRRKMERDADLLDVFAEPDAFSEKVPAWPLSADTGQWLDAWADEHPGTIRPTGKNARNYSPIVTADGAEESWWGMWDKGEPMKYGINATVEKLTRWPWGNAFKMHRILVPVTEYYEHHAEGGPKKQRYAFYLPDGEPVAFAGIAAELDGDDLPRTAYALITREPTTAASAIHNRMPMLLPPDFYETWLDPEREGDDELRAEALSASEEIVEQLTYERA